MNAIMTAYAGAKLNLTEDGEKFCKTFGGKMSWFTDYTTMEFTVTDPTSNKYQPPLKYVKTFLGEVEDTIRDIDNAEPSDVEWNNRWIRADEFDYLGRRIIHQINFTNEYKLLLDWCKALAADPISCVPPLIEILSHKNCLMYGEPCPISEDKAIEILKGIFN
jgi:hypothetical protein